MSEAIKKINIEIEKENNQYIQLIGQFLLGQLEKNPAAAEKILIEDKTLSGSLLAMAEVARNKAVNGMAMLTDEEGFAVVLDYYGIEKCEEVAIDKPQLTVIETPKSPEKKPKSAPKQKGSSGPDGQLDIFDMLGGAADAN